MSTAAQLMVKCLESEGVEYVFGIPGEENIHFVKALAELARSFGIPVVAEWVQDEGTVSLLAGWGIDCIQGALTGDVMDQPD